MPKLFVTGDLHYFHTEDREIDDMFKRLLSGATDKDILLVLGDHASAPFPDSADEAIEKGFKLMAKFPGRKLFVIGNHEIRVDRDKLPKRGSYSTERYLDQVPERARAHDIQVLDTSPVQIGERVFIGQIGPVGESAYVGQGAKPDPDDNELFLDIPDREGFDRQNLERFKGWLSKTKGRPLIVGFHVPPRGPGGDSPFWNALGPHLRLVQFVFCGHLHRPPDIQGLTFIRSDYHHPVFLEHVLE